MNCDLCGEDLLKVVGKEITKPILRPAFYCGSCVDYFMFLRDREPTRFGQDYEWLEKGRLLPNCLSAFEEEWDIFRNNFKELENQRGGGSLWWLDEASVRKRPKHQQEQAQQLETMLTGGIAGLVPPISIREIRQNGALQYVFCHKLRDLEDSIDRQSVNTVAWGDCQDKLKAQLPRNTGNKWIDELQTEMVEELLAKYLKRKMKFESEEYEKRVEQFMKLGLDMPEVLARAMANEIIPQAEAAQIFREGWHREPLTTKIMDELLTGKLNFENASWMQQNVNHEQMIQALLDGEIDLDVAKHLLNIGFVVNPLATAAVLDGNDIELVASMYGIVLPVVEEVIEEVPEVEIVSEPMVEETKEWGGRFDDT